MQPSQSFDYDRPTRDSLAGFYVEACDGADGEVSRVDSKVQTRPLPQALPRREDLFGLTLTVDDGVPSESTRTLAP